MRELQGRVEEYRALNEHVVITGNEPEFQSLKPEFPLVSIGPDPPTIIAGILGDCLQDYKSALDHAFYHLKVLHGGSKQPGLDKIEFPIFWRPDIYFQKRHFLIGTFPSGTQVFIDELQPYRGLTYADRKALFILWELARIDRHRHVHIVRQAIMGPAAISFTPVATREPQTDANATPGTAMNVEMAVPLSIVVDEPSVGIFRLVEGLVDIDLVVRAILDTLATGDYPPPPLRPDAPRTLLPYRADGVMRGSVVIPELPKNLARFAPTGRR